MQIDDDLAKLLHIKARSEERIFKAYSHVRFAAWVIGILSLGMIVTTTFVLEVRSQVHRNTDAIRILWEKQFSTRLPE